MSLIIKGMKLPQQIAKLVFYDYRAFQYNKVDMCPDCSQDLKNWFESPIKEREGSA